jgi:hypothetical protein
MVPPFDYKGEITNGSILPGDVERFQQTFLTKLKERLEKANIPFEVTGNELYVKPVAKMFSFRLGAILKGFHSDKLLVTSVPNLKFVLNEEEGTLSYHMSFTKVHVGYSIAFLVIFASFFFGVTQGPLLPRLGLLLFFWLVPTFAIITTSIGRFKQFVNRILDEMNVIQL